MPTPVEFVTSGADIETHIVCTFKANLSDLSGESFTSPKITGVPLRGDWHFKLETEDDEVTASFMHTALPSAAFGDQVIVTMLLESKIGDRFKELRTSGVASGPQPGMDPQSSTPYEGYRFPSISSLSPHSGLVSDPDSIRASKNVCLFFPRQTSAGHRIWTTAAFLEAGSAYFETMLTSRCIETALSRSKRQRTEDIKPDIDLTDDGVEKDWDDSDDETDSALVLTSDDEDDVDERDFRQVTVRESAFSTYRAVLLYLKTGHITFAPLRSSFRGPQADMQHESRAAFLTDYAAKNPKLPLPVSPKSVYRLAHLLQLPDLQELALEHLVTYLSADTVAYELFSPVAIAYDEVRKAIIDFAVTSFAAVQASDAWKELQEKANQGEIPGSPIVLGQLLAAVFKANSAS